MSLDVRGDVVGAESQTFTDTNSREFASTDEAIDRPAANTQFGGELIDRPERCADWSVVCGHTAMRARLLASRVAIRVSISGR